MDGLILRDPDEKPKRKQKPRGKPFALGFSPHRNLKGGPRKTPEWLNKKAWKALERAKEAMDYADRLIAKSEWYLQQHVKPSADPLVVGQVAKTFSPDGKLLQSANVGPGSEKWRLEQLRKEWEQQRRKVWRRP